MSERYLDNATLKQFEEANRETDHLLYKAKMREQERQKNEETKLPKPMVREFYDVVPSEQRDNIWNTWCDQRIVSLLDEYDRDYVAPAHNQLVKDTEREFDAALEQFDAMTAEIAALRTELTALRADMNVVAAVQRGEITALKKTAKSDAA